MKEKETSAGILTLTKDESQRGREVGERVRDHWF